MTRTWPERKRGGDFVTDKALIAPADFIPLRLLSEPFLSCGSNGINIMAGAIIPVCQP